MADPENLRFLAHDQFRKEPALFSYNNGFDLLSNEFWNVSALSFDNFLLSVQ